MQDRADRVVVVRDAAPVDGEQEQLRVERRAGGDFSAEPRRDIGGGPAGPAQPAALQADETRNRQIQERIPAGRWGDPSDLGGAAVFLASSASDYVQGAILPVDGGWQAR